LRKIISISLLLIFLTSHLGLAVGTHYCGGISMQTDLMIGHKHLDCGMEDMQKECNQKENEPRFEKVPCCENEYTSLDLTEDFNPAINAVNVDFAIAFISTYYQINPLAATIANRYQVKNYPPPVERDVQILFQTFLI
ncbi:unnamed protein product, partial [Chrysoparadoxa australica]